MSKRMVPPPDDDSEVTEKAVFLGSSASELRFLAADSDRNRHEADAKHNNLPSFFITPSITSLYISIFEIVFVNYILYFYSDFVKSAPEICHNTFMPVTINGGLEALRELNKKVPDDVAIIGFDNLPFSRITRPPLTSMSQPMFEMGQKAAQMLIDSIKKRKYSNKTVILKSRLVLRQSSHKDIPAEYFT